MSEQEHERKQTFLIGLKADPESFPFEIQLENKLVSLPQEFYLIGDFKCSPISDDLAKQILSNMNIAYPSGILEWELVVEPIYIRNKTL